ncbi:tyrosine-type recombinase/integrase [Nocardioides sp. Kera G14]|uniref:tyrosine-type recombinase/integrase n=1 Tax=Nocardioides sp. Kera G14 TaxID=2884264 RepID=UPI001D1038B5|nr:tyrosine-type recombinase/integrase [Nocardioides sp. Kera G14]UDY22403.1 tyrosine-type recombinase/integrase [Nocardioides sp. Kera G14]
MSKRPGSAADAGLSVADARVLAESWALSLRAERKSPQTLKTYGDGVRFYLDWCETTDHAPLVRVSLTTWTAHLLDTGAAASTATSRQLAVRRFASWLTDEGEIDADPFIGLKSPKIDQKVIEPLTADQLRAIVRACQVAKGTDPKEIFRRRRDEAILRFMIETGTRAGEVVAITLEDVNLPGGEVIVRRGKGGKGRRVPFGPEAALALDRYIRLRRTHRLAESPMLWLGDRGKGFTYDALHKTLGLRAAAAGIEGFHPHRLRHTAAHRWLAAGGSEGGLMAVAGWTRPDMLQRYTKARAEDRAAEEAKALNLGEL